MIHTYISLFPFQVSFHLLSFICSALNLKFELYPRDPRGRYFTKEYDGDGFFCRLKVKRSKECETLHFLTQKYSDVCLQRLPKYTFLWESRLKIEITALNRPFLQTPYKLFENRFKFPIFDVML